MRFSVITPSFNQAQFLPDNLRSVAGQTGARITVEHILVDPGSTDGSTELARAAKHAILIHEPDRGQSHGITKGFERCTGEIMTWLNSDDFYPTPRTLEIVASVFASNPGADIVYGNVNYVGEAGEFLRKGFVHSKSETLLNSFHQQVGIIQPGVFMRRRVFEKLGGPSEDYNYCMDYEYWVRMASAGFKWVFTPDVLAHHRWWDGMKTSSGRGDSLIEHFKVCAHHFGYIHWKWLDRYGEYIATGKDGVVNHANVVDQVKRDSFTRAAIHRFVTQDMLELLEQSDRAEHFETLAYIRRIAPDLKRIYWKHRDLTNAGAKTTHPDLDAEKRIAWHIFDTVTKKGGKFKTYRVPQNFERSFDARWYEQQADNASRRFAEFSAHRKDRCVIVGNGPSLNKSNLALLDQADVIISNFAVISKELRLYASYLTVVNDLVATQGTVDFNRLDIPKIMPFWLANTITEGENAVFLPATVIPEFCTAVGGVFSWRSTVSFFNMQVAFALGYQQVALIGFDHSYQQAASLKEGDSIDQKEEDPNHFDPRYFHGKTWQAADTDNMEKMYQVARTAYEKAGRRIVNCTVGGKLEVFPREPLETFLGRSTIRDVRLPVARPLSDLAARREPPLPRLLVLDMTMTGNATATGEIKANLLADWPAPDFLQVAAPGKDRLDLVRRGADGSYHSTGATEAEARAAITAFRPELILYRPLADQPHLHRLAMSVIGPEGGTGTVPLVTWIMDDWPARLQAENPAYFAEMDADLRLLLVRSAVRLSISEAMSAAFVTRYGLAFRAFANGVTPAQWPTVARTHAPGPLRVRYAGGLAPDMNAASVLRVAQAVERLNTVGQPVSFEISTRPWWQQASGALFKDLTATHIDTQDRSFADYVSWLCDADVVVIAYNFDAASLRYVQYSMANKMPELLASGAVLLAHGPRGIATIDYLAGTDAAVIVDEESDSAVEAALRALQADPARRNALVQRARTLAFSRHNLLDLRHDLRQIMADAARSGGQNAGAAPPAAPPDTATQNGGRNGAQNALRVELEQLKHNFEALHRHAAQLEAGQLEAGQPAARQQPKEHIPASAAAPEPQSSADFLSQMARAAEPAGEPDSGSLLLRSCASALLLDGPRMIGRLAADPSLSDDVQRALAARPDDDVLKIHFLKVRQHAEARSATGTAGPNLQ